MIRKIFILFTLLFFGVPSSVGAQVVINEFSSATDSDWIELYSSADVNISGWIIRDTASSIVKTIPADTIIGPTGSGGNFLVIEVGDRLNNGGDSIKLLNSDESQTIDSITYGDTSVCLPANGGSIGRYENGNVIDRFSNSTKGQSNILGTLDPCPSPTPTNTPTPTPTNKPDPTNTPTPTPIDPTNTPTPTIKPTSTVELSPTESDVNKEVLGQSESIESSRDKLIADGDIESPDIESKNKKFPIVAVFFVIGGLMFIIGAGYLYFKSQKIENAETKTLDDDEKSS